MGKRNSHANDVRCDARILFKKKSNYTIYSKTCSGISQFYTKSGMIKRNLSQTNQYYIDGDKVKRDLSIETNVCRLRRYYRSKRSKQSNQEGVSIKSKFSTVFVTDIDTIKECQPDNSACGDNDRTEENIRPDLDLTSMMIEDLKSLINKWITKYLLENKDTKQKIETVLDSLLHKFELNQPSTKSPSSCSTYVLNKDDQSQGKKKRIVTSITCHYSKQKSRSTGETPSYEVSKNSSYHSMLCPYKNLRIISTLSIPRNTHKHKPGKKKRNSLYRIKKIIHNDVLCSVNRPSKLFMDSSSYDLLAISTKSLTKRCVTYDTYKKKKKNIRNRRIVLLPQPDHNIITDTKATNQNERVKNKNKNHMDTVPSLVKSIYAGDPANVTSTDKNIRYAPRSDNCTMTNVNTSQGIATNITLVRAANKREKKDLEYVTNKSHISNQSKPSLTIDFYKENLEFPKNTKHGSISTVCKATNNDHTTNRDKKVKVSKRRKLCSPSKITSQSKYQNIKCKNFTYLYRKASANQDMTFFKHCQSIFKYFAEYEGKRNIKLDIHVNVLPMFENESNECPKKSVAKNGHESSSNQVLEQNPAVIYNVEPSIKLEEDTIKEKIIFSESKYDLGIIPILDGAANKAQYMFNENDVDSLKENTEIFKNDSAHSTNTCNLGITQELNELKSVIKNLASTTEKFIIEHQKHSRDSSTLINLSQNDSNINSSKQQSTSKKISKAVQFSSNFVRNQFQSGLKLTKEPKKNNPAEFRNRLLKKSISYNIIESESILKVTDMTSANEVYNYKVMDEALTCSLPKSKSLFELASDKNKRKILAFVCKNCNDGIYGVSSHMTSGLKKISVKSKIESLSQLSPSSGKCSKVSQPLNIDVASNETCDKCDTNTGDNYSTSIYIDEDDDLKCTSIQKHRGMHFGEGIVYCILLLIPLTIIAFLFYGYVIQDYLLAPYSENAKKKFYLKITDLGF